MIKCYKWPVGICSWSLADSLDNLARIREKLNVEHIQLNTCPALDGQCSDYPAAVKRQGWTITSTMVAFPQEDYSTLKSIKATGGVVPDEYWQDNRKRVFDAIDLTAELGVKYLLFHFGFLDLKNADQAGKLCDRAKILADRAAEKNVQLLMETGQENAAELRQFLERLNHSAIGVNFDPANMILYDKDNPIKAVQTLSPWIKHIHIKDAIRTKVKGTWGLEVPWGDGQVGGDNFLAALKNTGFNGPLAIEREVGDNRFEDIKLAAERLSRYSG